MGIVELGHIMPTLVLLWSTVLDLSQQLFPSQVIEVDSFTHHYFGTGRSSVKICSFYALFLTAYSAKLTSKILLNKGSIPSHYGCCSEQLFPMCAGSSNRFHSPTVVLRYAVSYSSHIQTVVGIWIWLSKMYIVTLLSTFVDHLAELFKTTLFSLWAFWPSSAL